MQTYIVPDSSKQITITGLRPNTIHFFLQGGNNQSALAQPNGFNIGDPLFTNSSGGLSFTVYQSNTINGFLNNLPPALANVFFNQSSLNTSNRAPWLVTDPTGSSIAQGSFYLQSSPDPTPPAQWQAYADASAAANSGATTSSTSIQGNANAASNGAVSDTTSTSPATSTSTVALGTGPVPPIAQVLYVDPAQCQNATEIYFTSFDLFCKAKPAAQQNQSGMSNPGVNIYLVPTVTTANAAKPSFTNLNDYISARREYTDIVPSIDASTPTNFKLSMPVPAKTAANYAIVVKADGNEEFDWWDFTIGDATVPSGNAAISLGNQFIGAYYELSSDSQNWTPLSGKALKFQSYIARFFQNGQPVVANADTLQLHVNNFEFIEYDIAGSTGVPMGGEMMYQAKLAPDGYCTAQIGNNIIVTSNALSFSSYYSNPAEPMYIVLDGGSFRNVRKVVSFTNTTATLDAGPSFNQANTPFYATTAVGKVYLTGNSVANTGVRKTVILANSTANSLVKFTNGSIVIGEVSGAKIANISLQSIIATEVTPQVALNVPAGSSYTATEMLSYTTPDGTSISTANPISFAVEMFKESVVPGTATAIVPSRSLEVGLAANSLSSTPSNSSIVKLDVISTNDFVCPAAGQNGDVLFTQYFINNDYTGENTKYGNALSKDISVQISLGTGSFAQDLLVNLIGYRPPTTDFKVFAKIFNSNDPDYFDDKDWTLLQCTNNASVYSSSTNGNDFIQYTYGLRPTPNTLFTFNGSVTATSGNATLIAASPIFASNVAVGDLLKVYSPLFANSDYFISSVVNVINSTALVIDTAQSNASLLGAGLKVDKLAFPKQAFSNFSNSNCVRYYDSNMAFHDMFDNFALKVVFLSPNPNTVPYLSSARATATTA